MPLKKCKGDKIMKKAMKLLLVLVLVFGMLTGVANAETVRIEYNYDMILFNSIEQYVRENYYQEFTRLQMLEKVIDYIISEYPEMRDVAIEGLTQGLDDYSTYLTEEEYNELFMNINKEFGGIGIRIQETDGFVTIINVIEGTPGQEAGLKANDKIKYVDGEDIEGYSADQAAIIMRGTPGTKVRLGIIRDGRLIYFDIIRELIVIKSVTYEVMEDNVGYIKISDFSTKANEEMIEALQYFDSLSITDLVIDVRNNPGGSLYEVIEMCQLFVSSTDPIVTIDYREREDITYYGTNVPDKYDISVLINENSASASEIFAACLQDNNEAQLVGKLSFGKGSVQEIVKLNFGGGIKITVAKYKRPNGEYVDGVGVSPDYEIDNDIKVLTYDDFQYFIPEGEFYIGDSHPNIYQVEKRLYEMNLIEGSPDNVFDIESSEALKQIQSMYGLEADGVLDKLSQYGVRFAVKDYKVIYDLQLEKAIELLK